MYRLCIFRLKRTNILICSSIKNEASSTEPIKYFFSPREAKTKNLILLNTVYLITYKKLTRHVDISCLKFGRRKRSVAENRDEKIANSDQETNPRDFIQFF